MPHAKECLRLLSPEDQCNITKFRRDVQGYPGMVGSLDCSHTYFKNFPKVHTLSCPPDLHSVGFCICQMSNVYFTPSSNPFLWQIISSTVNACLYSYLMIQSTSRLCCSSISHRLVDSVTLTERGLGFGNEAAASRDNSQLFLGFDKFLHGKNLDASTIEIDCSSSIIRFLSLNQGVYR
jgi:hypothetical protein